MTHAELTKNAARNDDLVRAEKMVVDAYEGLRRAKLQQAECFFRMMRLEPQNAHWYGLRIFAMVINNEVSWGELTFSSWHVKEREQRAMIA